MITDSTNDVSVSFIILEKKQNTLIPKAELDEEQTWRPKLTKAHNHPKQFCASHAPVP